jgi:Mn2+/Fe2+ NRAMP family transporter
MERSSQLLFKNQKILSYRFWLIVLSLGTLGIFTFLLSEMGTLVQIATVLSFITAPFYAILNFRLVTSDQMPLHARPSKSLRFLSLIGIILLSLFAVGFVFIAA